MSRARRTAHALVARRSALSLDMLQHSKARAFLGKTTDGPCVDHASYPLHSADRQCAWQRWPALLTGSELVRPAVPRGTLDTFCCWRCPMSSERPNTARRKDDHCGTGARRHQAHLSRCRNRRWRPPPRATYSVIRDRAPGRNGRNGCNGFLGATPLGKALISPRHPGANWTSVTVST